MVRVLAVLTLLSFTYPLVWPASLTVLLSQCAEQAQDFCKAQFAQDRLRPLYSAMVCGERISDPRLVSDFQHLGLIHLLVVSGSHLIFLQSLVSGRGSPLSRGGRWILYPLLSLYVLLSGLQAPALRSLIAILASDFGLRSGLSGLQVQWLAGTLCLCLFPPWYESLSLQLSWVAGSCISSSLLVGRPWLQAALLHLFLMPLLSALTGFHPLQIAANVLIAPLIGFLLFPISLLYWLLPPLKPIADLVWQLTLELVHALAPSTLPSISWPNFSNFVRWIYVLSVSLLLHLVEFQCRKKL